MKAIETHYAGCRFRSRLEARWAVFFDTMEIPWQYEPQGYTLSNGQNYLPDFLLTGCGTWVEVKGSKAAVNWHVLALAGLELPVMPHVVEAGPNLLLLGSIPRPNDFGDYGWPSWSRETDSCYTVTWPAGFGSYHKNSRPWIFDPGAIVTAPPDDLSWFDDRESSAAQQAYRTARSARFEHGECG